MRRIFAVLLIVLCLVFSACGKPGETTDHGSDIVYADEEDLDVRESDPGMTIISFLADGVAVSGEGAQSMGNSVAVNAGGMYFVEGDNPEGSIGIVCSENVKMVLNGANIGQITSKSAKTVVTLSTHSNNSVSSVSASGALTFNGSGTLSITDEGNTLECTDFLMLGGNIAAQAGENVLSCSGKAVFGGGFFSCSAGEYAVKAADRFFMHAGSLELSGKTALSCRSASIPGGDCRISALECSISAKAVEYFAGRLICESNGQALSEHCSLAKCDGVAVFADNSEKAPRVPENSHFEKLGINERDTLLLRSDDGKKITDYTSRGSYKNVTFVCPGADKASVEKEVGGK